MDTDIKMSVKATDTKAQYDNKAKQLLGHKIILAHILVNTVAEFKGMNPADVVQYIEGEPHIGSVPVDAGATNIETQGDSDKSLKYDRIVFVFLYVPIKSISN